MSETPEPYQGNPRARLTPEQERLLAELDRQRQAGEVETEDILTWIDRALKAEAERDRVVRLVQELTPYGSEFHDAPERCVEWAKARMLGAQNAAVKAMRERREVKAERDALAVDLTELRAISAEMRDALDADVPPDGAEFTLLKFCNLLDRPADQRGREIIAAGTEMAEVCRAHAAVWGRLVDGAALRAAVERWEAAVGPVADASER